MLLKKVMLTQKTDKKKAGIKSKITRNDHAA